MAADPNPGQPRPPHPPDDAATHPDAGNETRLPVPGTWTDSATPAGPPAASALPSIPGYVVEAEIGFGATAVVYKARHTKLNRPVALKILSAARSSREDLARFRSEAETVAQLTHPNVIQVYDVGEHNGVPYIAAEYADGGDLRDWLRGKRLTVRDTLQLVYTLARAVGAAHKKRIVHRDLKPANILIAGGVPKVADFGLAKVIGDAGQTATGALLGTPYYMSPEQAAGKGKSVGPQTDVFSLGVILYECLAGRLPFAGDTLLETLDRLRFEQPPALGELRPDIPPTVVAIVRRCLEKIPEERYRTADDLAFDLARVVREPDLGGVKRDSIPNWLLLLGAALALFLAWFIARESGFIGGNTKPTPAPTEPLPPPPPKFTMP